MPRNGSGVYSKPAGTTAVANTVVESSKYNQTIDDLVDDNNAARPVVAGGTGATSAGSARTNLGVDPARTFVTKSAGYTALAADKAANIRFDGAYTLSLTAAATLGSGWYCYVQADGGAVTIDPNASETINGADTLTLNDGYSTVIWCDGSNFRAIEDFQRQGETFGQCRLTLSGGNLSLGRFNGRLLTINGVHETIPSTAPTLAATSLTPSTLYYIYAYMNSGTMTLEASTTGHATDSTTGVEIKSGDATRTLVGMARPVTGPAWTDTVTQRFVRSWYNRKPEAMRKAFTAIRSTTSTSLTEVNSEIRCEWLQWADEIPTAHIQGTASNGSASVYTNTAIGWDGTADANTLNSITSATGLAYNCSTSAPKEGLSEGYHYATLMGSVSSASTGSWTSGVSGVFTSLSVSIG